jgi:CHAD domain-containing protein
MKKLRAILRLIEPGVSAASLRVLQSNMRALKKAFAMNRDQHVLNALLAEFCNGNTASSHSDYLAPEMGDFSNGPPEPARLRKLQAAARELTNRLQNMTIRPLEWSDVAQAYAKRYAKARKGLRRCEQKPSPARLHRWRSPVKDHYFESLLMLRDRRHCKTARKLGSMLGQMHDLTLLREHYARDDSNNFAPPIKRLMKNLRARIFRRARHLLVHSPRKIKHLAMPGDGRAKRRSNGEIESS